MSEMANILVLGTSGAGKSTLINTVIGEEVAKVGNGKHITEKMNAYECEELGLRLIDSRGFEYNIFNTSKSVGDMKNWLKSGLKDEKPRIHMLWFCVDATSKRFTKQTIKTMETVKKEWKNVPIIVVLTKSFFVAEDADNIDMVKMNFAKFAKESEQPVAIVPVLALPPKGTEILSRGIDELVAITLGNTDRAIEDSKLAVKKFDIKQKKFQAQMLTVGAATSAAVVGAVPISFPDSTILTPLEMGLITAISKIYKVDSKDDVTKQIIARIVEAGAVSVVAKSIINQLKLVPGLVNLAADVLNAIVAGVIVFGIGEASTIIMEKVYLGDIDKKNLDWIDKIVAGSMNQTLLKTIKKISEGKGKIKIEEIIKSLVKK